MESDYISRLHACFFTFWSYLKLFKLHNVPKCVMKQHRIPWCTSESLLTCCVSFAGRTDALLFQKRLFVCFHTGSLWKANSLRAVCDFSSLSVIVSCLLGSTAQDESASANNWISKSVSLLLLECNCLHIRVESILRGLLPVSPCRAAVCRDQSYLGSDIQRYDAVWPPWSLLNFQRTADIEPRTSEPRLLFGRKTSSLRYCCRFHFFKAWFRVCL